MNVLVVDDEEEYRRMLSLVMSADGFEVKTAANCDEAIDGIREFPPDIVVMDWMLRNSINGLEVCESLRRFVPDFSMVLITGYPSDELRGQAAALRVEYFIEKPFGVDDFLVSIRRVRERRERRISKCVSCGWRLPLLRPRPGETGSSWICGFCGARYSAVLDAFCPEDIIRNALPVK
jgi:DNA-binding response OmpR family regulator